MNVDDGWGYACEIEWCPQTVTHSVANDREMQIEMPRRSCSDHVEEIRKPGDRVFRLSDGRMIHDGHRLLR